METQANNLILDIAEKIEKYGRFTDVSNIAHMFERFLRTYDEEVKTFLLGRVLSKLNQIEKSFPTITFAQDPPVINDINTGIKVGRISVADVEIPFMLSKEDLNKNIMIAAAVGHGKTSLVYNILSKLEQENVTYILFDLKRDYKALGLDENTIYLNTESLRINPLVPPKGVKLKEWAVHFADAFAQSFSLLIGSRDFLLDSLMNFYNNLNEKEIPSIPEFIAFLDRFKVNNEYIKVVRGRLKALVSSTDVFNCKNGMLLSDLDKNNLIFGVDNLGVPEQGFLLAFILSYLFYTNINDTNKRNKLHKLIVIDDAHALLDVNKEKDYAMGIPLVHQMIAKMRELGVGFIFSDQQVSSLVSSAIQNSNIKFIGRINLIDDFNKLFSFPINKEIPEKISSLSVGEFLVISPKIKPYAIVKVDKVKIQKDVDDSILNIKHRNILPKVKEEYLTTKEINFINEIGSYPLLDRFSHIANLSKTMDEKEFYNIESKLFGRGILDELDMHIYADRKDKFIYIPKSAASRLIGLSVKTWDKQELVRIILRNIILEKLKKEGVMFSEDEVGVLVSGLRKVYITFMDDGTTLSRLIETSFDRIINVIDNSLTKESIMNKVAKEFKGQPKSLNVIKICSVNDFNLI